MVPRAGAGNLQGTTIPPPVKGWDAASSLENMDPEAAIILDNWFPEPAYVRLRGGHAQHATTYIGGNDTHTKVLLHFNGTDASTTITDSNAGGSAHTWTANGDAQIDTAASKFGGASGLFDGTGDYVSTPDHADFTVGASDFTIDGWFNFTGTSGGSVFGFCGQRSTTAAADTSLIVFRNTSDVIVGRACVGSTAFNVTGTTTFNNASHTGWHHIAFVRNGNTLKLFIDGIQEGGDVSISGTVNDSSGVWSVGDISAESLYWKGWIDEFRLSVGVARWTANFTPPTLPYESSAGDVESIMAYHGSGGTEKLFCARDTTIYDVTGTPSEAVVGLTNARWQHINYATGGSMYLYCVNGADTPRYFNGSTWTTASISGETSSTFIHVNAHKHRIWFIEASSTKACYLATDAVAGAASPFDLGPQMTRGGYLMAMGTWTMDSGYGPDDYAVFITSKGQVIVYGGNDPSDANNWTLKGVYEVGPPIGRRCMMKIGPDLAIITMDGVISLAQAIQQDRAVVNRAAITAKILRAINQATRDAGANYGWQGAVYSKGTAFILNVPLTVGAEYHQYVMNTLTGAWCRYKGQNAICWEIFQDLPYFGGLDGVVYLADSTGRDNGALIVADMKTAFNYLGARGVNKNFAIMRAHMYADGTAIPSLTINCDFRDSAPSTVASSYTATGAVWGSFNWGDGTLWAGGNVTLADWVDVNDAGYCVAVRMKIAPENSNASAIPTLQINGFDIKFEAGRGAL